MQPLVLPGVIVTDTAAVTDTPTVQLGTIGTQSVSVSDSAQLAETVTVRALALAGVNVTDSATTTDTPTVRPLALAGVNASDAPRLRKPSRHAWRRR